MPQAAIKSFFLSGTWVAGPVPFLILPFMRQLPDTVLVDMAIDKIYPSLIRQGAADILLARKNDLQTLVYSTFNNNQVSYPDLGTRTPPLLTLLNREIAENPAFAKLIAQGTPDTVTEQQPV